MIEENDDLMDINSIHDSLVLQKWEWLLGYMHPEVFSPGRLPQYLAYPTHTFTSKFNDVVNVYKSSTTTDAGVIEHPSHAGKFWIYFAPANDLLEMTMNSQLDQLHNNIVLNTTYYASSNGPLKLTDFTHLYPIDISGENKGRKSSGPFAGYKQLRVNSASIVITPSGPIKSSSGIIKVGYSFKRADLDFEKINFEKFENYFQTTRIYQVKNHNNIICRYRPYKDILTSFAPYEPTTELPYFVICGEGISSEMTFNITVVRHFEGIVLPQYSQLFYNISKYDTMSLPVQEAVANIMDDPNPITMESDKQMKFNVKQTVESVANLWGNFTERVEENPALAQRFKNVVSGVKEAAKKTAKSYLPPPLVDASVDALEVMDNDLGLVDNMINMGGAFLAQVVMPVTPARF